MGKCKSFLGRLHDPSILLLPRLSNLLKVYFEIRDMTPCITQKQRCSKIFSIL